MYDIDRLIRSLRAWRKHRLDWAPLLDEIEAQLRQQACQAATGHRRRHYGGPPLPIGEAAIIAAPNLVVGLEASAARYGAVFRAGNSDPAVYTVYSPRKKP